MAHYCELQPTQLCDLLNFVLGRPIQRRHIPRISVCVVDSWTGKHQRTSVMVWCERQLIDEGVLPKETRAGRRRGMRMPGVLTHFLEQQ